MNPRGLVSQGCHLRLLDRVLDTDPGQTWSAKMWETTLGNGKGKHRVVSVWNWAVVCNDSHC
jgi:hypothetical protein